MEFIIDIQAFFNKEYKIIPKEVSIVSLQGEAYAHWTIKPPHDFSLLSDYLQRANNTLTRYVHDIEWFEGDITESELKTHLKDIVKSAKKIYVYGNSKTDYLINIVGRKIVNIENYGAPTLSELASSFTDSNLFTCVFHAIHSNNWRNCTTHRAVLIKKWLQMLRKNTKELKQKIANHTCNDPYIIDNKDNMDESETLDALEKYSNEHDNQNEDSISSDINEEGRYSTSTQTNITVKQKEKTSHSTEENNKGEETEDNEYEYVSVIGSDPATPSSEHRRIPTRSNTSGFDETDCAGD